MFPLADDVIELLALDHFHVSDERFDLSIIQAAENLHPSQSLRFHAEAAPALGDCGRAGDSAKWFRAQRGLKLRQIGGLLPSVVVLSKNPLMCLDPLVPDPLDQAGQIDGTINDAVHPPHPIRRNFCCVFHVQVFSNDLVRPLSDVSRRFNRRPVIVSFWSLSKAAARASLLRDSVLRGILLRSSSLCE